MYAEYFGLREQPFTNTFDPRFYFSSQTHEDALASLIYTIGEGKGLTVLTGESGTGKTLLTRMALAHFSGRIAFAESSVTPLGERSVLQSLCIEFGVDVPRDADSSATVYALQDFLLDQFSAHRPVAAIVDDAHLLSVEALDELRFLCNLQASNARLIQVVLVGQPELSQTLAAPKLRALRQRCFRTSRLAALDVEQTGAYIASQLAVAGESDSKLFDAKAVEVVHQLSGGLPRLINTLCDNVLLSAFTSERREIDAAFVSQVHERTCVPWSKPSAARTGAVHAVEGGAGGASIDDRVIQDLASRIDDLAHLVEAGDPSARVPAQTHFAVTNVTGQSSGLENRMTELQRQIVSAESERAAATARRLEALDRKMDVLRDDQREASKQSRDRQVEAHAQIEKTLGDSQRRADASLKRINDQSRRAELVAARVRKAYDNVSRLATSDVGGRRPAGNAGTAVTGKANVGVRIPATPQTPARALPVELAGERSTRRLLSSVRGLAQLAERVQFGGLMPPDDAND